MPIVAVSYQRVKRILLIYRVIILSAEKLLASFPRRRQRRRRREISLVLLRGILQHDLSTEFRRATTVGRRVFFSIVPQPLTREPPLSLPPPPTHRKSIFSRRRTGIHYGRTFIGINQSRPGDSLHMKLIDADCRNGLPQGKYRCNVFYRRRRRSLYPEIADPGNYRPVEREGGWGGGVPTDDSIGVSGKT